AIEFRQYPRVCAKTPLPSNNLFLTQERLVNAPAPVRENLFQRPAQTFPRRRMIFLNTVREAVAPLAGEPAAKHFDFITDPVATIPHRSIPPRLPETPVPAIRGIRAYHSTRPDCASTAFRSAARVDAGIRVSSVASLTIGWRIDVPTLFQRLADLGLSEPFLLL